MKARWIQTLVALGLPPVAGAAAFVAFFTILKETRLFSQSSSKAAPASHSTPEAPPRSRPAELRAAIPAERIFTPPPGTKSETGVVKALASGGESVLPQAAVEGALEKPGSVGPPVRRVPVVEVRRDAPRVWRPILDPVADFWPSLWPRTDALPVIFQAVLLRDAEHVARLVAMGFSPEEKTFFGDTALCAAVRSGQDDMVRTLAVCGVDLNDPGRENQAPILIASLRRNTPVLAALTELGVDPNTRFKSPVSREIVERCTIKDLRNAMESDRGITPLVCCAARGDVEGAVTLMRAGARPGMCTSRYHRYPLNFAATQGYLFLMRVLLGRDPDSEPDTLVTVDLSSQRAWVTKRGQVVATTSVSTGREGYRTPAGRYVITDKHRTHTSTLYHVAMPWFMRLNCSAIGLHSGYVTGRPASHGCIRLPYDMAKLFFSLTQVGDEVQIVH
jgi:hypothetical protein